MSNERNYGIFGFLAGAAIGASLGILFAPRSGKETRALIAKRARSAKDELDETIEKAQEKWAEAKGKAADFATMTKEEVADFVRYMFEEGEELKERVSKRAEDAASRVKRSATQSHNGH